MRILVYGLSNVRGGVESFIINNCTYIQSKYDNIRFDFVVIDSIPSFVENLQEQGSHFHVVQNRISHPFLFKRELNSILTKTGYDYIWYNVCTLSDITLLEIAKKKSIKTIIHSHNSQNMGNSLNLLLHKAHKARISSLGDCFFACSKDAGRFMFSEKKDSQCSFDVMRNTIDVDMFRFSDKKRVKIRKELGLEGLFVLGHVGRFHPQKNHEYLLDVFSRYYQEDKNSALILIGGGERKNIDEAKEKARALNVLDRVLFLGEKKDIASYYSAMDCFVFPSRYEGFPFSPIEAQASGLPCLVSDVCPENIIMLPSSVMLDIDSETELWVNEIRRIKKMEINREEGVLFVEHAGYGLCDSTEWFLKKIGYMN